MVRAVGIHAGKSRPSGGTEAGAAPAPSPRATAAPSPVHAFAALSIHPPGHGASGASPVVQFSKGKKKRAKPSVLTRKHKQDSLLQANKGKISGTNVVAGNPDGSKVVRLRRQPAERGALGFDKMLPLKPGVEPYGQMYYKKIAGKHRHVDFSRHVIHQPGYGRMETRIRYQGTIAKDFAEANKAFGMSEADRKKRGVWHHVPDLDAAGYGTLQLVPRPLHSAYGHYGGVEQYRKLAKAKGLPCFY